MWEHNDDEMQGTLEAWVHNFKTVENFVFHGHKLDVENLS